MLCCLFFFSSRRRHTRCALVTGVQTCALPICSAMEAIEADDTVLKATVIYPSTQAADGVALARLIAQGKTVSDIVTPSVPNRIVLDAPVVTRDNVADFIDLSFE